MWNIGTALPARAGLCGGRRGSTATPSATRKVGPNLINPQARAELPKRAVARKGKELPNLAAQNTNKLSSSRVELRTESKNPMINMFVTKRVSSGCTVAALEAQEPKHKGLLIGSIEPSIAAPKASIKASTRERLCNKTISAICERSKVNAAKPTRQRL